MTVKGSNFPGPFPSKKKSLGKTIAHNNSFLKDKLMPWIFFLMR